MLRVGLELDMMARYGAFQNFCVFCIIYEDFDILEHHLKSCFFSENCCKMLSRSNFSSRFFSLDSQLNF